MHDAVPQAPVWAVVRAWPDERASMFWPPCGLTLFPQTLSMPTWRPGAANAAPLARTYCALITPHVFCGRGGLAVVVRHSSMAFAASPGATSSSASPVSHGAGGSYVPSQSWSTWLGSPGRSKAPGLTVGSQSLQSPSAGLHPSPSMSRFGLVTTQPLLPELDVVVVPVLVLLSLVPVLVLAEVLAVPVLVLPELDVLAVPVLVLPAPCPERRCPCCQRPRCRR